MGRRKSRLQYTRKGLLLELNRLQRRGEMTAIERMGQEALMTNTQTHTHTQCLEEAGTRWASLPAACLPGVEGGPGVQVGVTFILQVAVPECQVRKKKRRRRRR